MNEEAPILFMGRPQCIDGGRHDGAEIDVERLGTIKQNVPRMCILKGEAVFGKFCLNVDNCKGRVSEHCGAPLKRVGDERYLSMSNDHGRAIESQGRHLGVNEEYILD